MGIDNESVLCLGVELGNGEEMQETFEAFLKKRGKIPQDDDEDNYEYAFFEIFELMEKELDEDGTSLSSSPFSLRCASPYFDCEYEHVVLYVTYKECDCDGISIEEALKLLQKFDKEALYAFLREIGVEEEIEPRIFSLPHIH